MGHTVGIDGYWRWVPFDVAVDANWWVYVPVDEAGLKGLFARLRKDVRVGLGVSTPLSPVIDELDNMMGGEFESWTGVPR